MAIKNHDLVEQVTTTTGTGDLTMGSALPGRRTVAAAVGDFESFHYKLSSADGSVWEIGRGTRDGSTVMRDEIFRNNAGGTTAVNLPSGANVLTITQHAQNAPLAGKFAAAPSLGGASIDGQIAWGDGAFAKGADSIALGTNAQASADTAIEAIAIGKNATAADGAIAFANSTASQVGAFASGGADISDDGYMWMTGTANGYGQGGVGARSWQTVGAANANMRLWVPSTSVVLVTALVVARRASDGAVYSAKSDFCAKSSEIFGTPAFTEIFKTSGVTVDATIPTGSPITIRGTGAADETWNWTTTLTIAEVRA